MFSNNLNNIDFFNKLQNKFNIKICFELDASGPINKIILSISQNNKMLSEMTLYSELLISLNENLLFQISDELDNLDDMYNLLIEQLIIALVMANISDEEYLNIFTSILTKKDFVINEDVKFLLMENKEQFNKFNYEFNKNFSKELILDFQNDFLDFSKKLKE